jgi:BirA family biotin operon repressor/biotin-[acetyl-CoA-carboxylase] ligase
MIGENIIKLSSVDSTNNYANSQLGLNDLPDGTVFLAYQQLEGRGQQHHYWESEPGQNLTFSIVVNPDFLDILQQFMLSKVVTIGIYSVLNKYVDQLKIKWPNDIYAGNQKLGGILIEHSIMQGMIKNSIIGVGININQTIFRSNAPNPVSLKMLTNQHHDCEVLLTEILSGINQNYELLKQGQFDQINQAFTRVMYRLNEKSRFNSEKGEFIGQIIGVNQIGQLMIKTDSNQTLVFHFKEVEFLF